jgi:hypothetical protein
MVSERLLYGISSFSAIKTGHHSCNKNGVLEGISIEPNYTIAYTTKDLGYLDVFYVIKFYKKGAVFGQQDNFYKVKPNSPTAVLVKPEIYKN